MLIEKEMFRTFNMGIGMVVVCSATDKDSIQKALTGSFEVGSIVAGNKDVRIA